MGLIDGARYPFRGLLFLLKNLGLWKYAVMPLLINLVLLTTAGVLLFGRFDELFSWSTSFMTLIEPDAWYGWPVFILKWLVKYTVGLLLFVASVLALYVLFLVLAAILASPFNDLLSERVELLYSGRVLPETPFSIATVLREGGTAIVEELRKAAFFVAMALAILALHLIPLVGSLLYPVVSGAFTMFFLSLEFVDFSMSRRKLRFHQKRTLLFDNRRAMFGFGATMAAGIAIPIANLLVLPVGAVGGTLLYLDLEAQHGCAPAAEPAGGQPDEPDEP